MRLESLGRWSCRRRRLVVVMWLMVLGAAVVAGRVAGGELDNNLQLPGTESQRAFDVLQSRFPELAGDTATIAFRSPEGVRSPAVRAGLEPVFAAVGRLDHVAAVVSPYAEQSQSISPDGRIGFALVQFDVRATEVPKSVIFAIKDAAEEAARPGLQVEVGGDSVRFAETEGPGEREGVGIVAAMIILLIAFGSAVAMGLPIITAIFGIGVTLSLVAVLSRFMAINNFAPQVASMIGLGVGIDYALFIVTRYRENLQRGLGVDDAVAGATATAGRAVVLAGMTVVISLMAMFFTGLPFIYGFGAGPALAVLVMVAAALTLLPAILGFVGMHIDRLRIPGFRPERSTGEDRLAFRWSRSVQRHPVLFGGVGLLALVVLALPAFSIRLGWAGAGANPDDRTTRRAHDLLSEGFGPGFNEPLLVVAELPGPGRLDAIQPLLAGLAGTGGVAVVAPPRLNATADVAAITVFSEYAPSDHRADELIGTLRNDLIPETTGAVGVKAYVAGLSPLFYDMSKVLGSRTPVVVAGVLALSFLLLMAVFRSVLVPLKAVIMNLLSIGAAYGVVVAVFQWGWVRGIAGIDTVGPIESFIPIILFAILFGLSMDYEVFLLSRIRERYLETGDNSGAVADGLASTARVITAAAAIMVALFSSFVLGDERIIKLIGLGLAVAVLVDATLVRMLLVPATMELLGRANWWLPRWLGALLPTVKVEGESSIPPGPPAGVGKPASMKAD
jgi:RND superfamily putative drug exporter